MIWYILIILFLFLLTWILIGPIIVRVNSESGIYRFSLPGVVSLSVVPGGSLVLLKVWLFFIPFTIDPIKAGGEKRRSKKGNRKKRKGFNPLRSKGVLKRLGRAIRIKRLNLNLDTDNFILNAQLVPIFSTVNNQENINMQVNFEGNLFLDLDLRTRISAILWLLINNRKH